MSSNIESFGSNQPHLSTAAEIALRQFAQQGLQENGYFVDINATPDNSVKDPLTGLAAAGLQSYDDYLKIKPALY